MSNYDVGRLGPIVATSRTLAEVLRKLGLPPTGGNYRHLNTRLRLAGLDTSHLRSRTLAVRVADIPDTALAALVAECTSVAQVLAKFDLPTEGRAHRELGRRIVALALDTRHFRGHGWSRGETKESHPSVERVSRRNRMTDAEIFVENASLYKGSRIVRRLVELGWDYRCAWCGIVEWRGQRLVLHLDHINGINNDNRLINLRILCPNCHSQTPTYANHRR
jgi:hypothetical protein